MAFYQYHSNRLEELIQPLYEALENKKKSPFVRETVLVQSIAMGRYFVLEYAKQAGICANFDILFPDKLFKTLHRLLDDNTPALGKESLNWMLFSLLNSGTFEAPELIRDYISSGDSFKCFKLSSVIADTFDQYAIYRNSSVSEWKKNSYTLQINGRSEPVPEGEIWQCRLWNTLFPESGKDHRGNQQRKIIDYIVKGGELPYERITVFGISTLPLFYLEILMALAGRIDIHLAILNPAEGFWDDIEKKERILSKQIDALEKDEDPDLLYYYLGNEILSANGTLGQEFFRLLSMNDNVLPPNDYFVPAKGKSLLESIQNDILSLVDRKGEEKNSVAKGDVSIQVHGCHSIMREVEILKDVIIDLFENDPELEPRDILIMTPKISDYAPYIESVFGQSDGTPAPLPYSIADLNLSDNNNMAEALELMFKLFSDRITVSNVSDLLHYPSVSRKFGIQDKDVGVITDWLYDGPFRWGVDKEERREELGIAFEEFSLEHARKRLVSGFIFGGNSDILYQGINPCADFEGEDAHLLGSLLEFLDTVVAYRRLFQKDHTPLKWYELLHALIDDFFLLTADNSEEYEEVGSAFVHLKSATDNAGFAGAVGFDIVIYYLSSYLSQERKRFGFIDGRITFCEILPMRSIPFKCIALLGMGESVFPRKEQPNGFDLTRQFRAIGDRSQKSDDRYLFLETLLSCRSYLYMSYTAFSEHDNSEKSPSPLIRELFDYIEANYEYSRDDLLTLHKLQPYARHYFVDDNRYFSFSERYEKAAQSYYNSEKSEYRIVKDDLSLEDGVYDLSLNEVQGFFSNSSRWYVKRVGGMDIVSGESVYSLEEPLALVGLDAYTVEEEVESALMANSYNDENMSLLFAQRGNIPPLNSGRFGYMSKSLPIVDFYENHKDLLASNDDEEISGTLSFQCDTIAVTLSGRCVVNSEGERVIVCRKMRAKQRLSFWLEHLFLSALMTDNSVKTTVYTLEGTFQFAPVSEGHKKLDNIIKLYLKGLTAPLPFFVSASYEIADKIINKGMSLEDAYLEIARLVENNYSTVNEFSEHYAAYCFRDKGRIICKEFIEAALTVYKPMIEVYNEL